MLSGVVVASFIVAVIAVIVSIWSVWRGDRSANRANTAAEKSQVAAEQSAAAAERSAAAAEQQTALAVAAAERYEVPWTLVRAGGSMWRLTNNNGIETAYKVRVREAANGSIPHPLKGEFDLGPRGSIEFFGVGADFDHPNTDISVTWRRTPDGPDEPSWFHPTG